jgi:hypothetical protein
LLSQYTSENNSLDLQSDCNRFGWHKQSDGESYQHFTMDHGPPSGRDDNHLYSAYADARMNSNNAAVNGYDPCAAVESQEQDKQIPFQSWRKGKADRYNNQNPREETIKMNNNVAADRRQRDISGAIHTRLKSRDATDSDMDILDPDEELDAILKVRYC